MKTDVLYLENRSRLLPPFTEMKYLARENVWVDIKGCEGCYQISSKGIVKSLARKSSQNILVEEKFRALRDKGGYSSVILSIDGKEKECSAHRLVATAFLIRPEGKDQVNHIDGNKSNNCWWNLEWVTVEENNAHAKANNLTSLRKKRLPYQRRHPAPKLSEENLRLVKGTLSSCIKELAERFGVKPGMIRNIARKLNGKHMYS